MGNSHCPFILAPFPTDSRSSPTLLAPNPMNYQFWIADKQPTRTVVTTDLNGNQTTLIGCNLHFEATKGFVIYAPSQYADIVLLKRDILSISRQECTQWKGMKIVLQRTRLDFASVDITMPSSSSALSLLHSIDAAWPDIRLEYCECTAAMLSTCARPVDDTVDRQEWPSARLTLAEWNPAKGKLEIETVETDVVAMNKFYVFHLSGKHKSLLIRRAECLSPPVPLLSPFVGTKLHLSSPKYITKRADLGQFMNTMLYPWGKMTTFSVASTLKRPHSDADDSTTSTALSEAGDELRNASVPPPVKRIRRCDDFLRLSTAVVQMTTVGERAYFVLSNLGLDRAMFRIRLHSPRQPNGPFSFSIVNGFVESGEHLSIGVYRRTQVRCTENYRIEFARAPDEFDDPIEAFKASSHIRLTVGVLPVAAYAFQARAV